MSKREKLPRDAQKSAVVDLTSDEIEREFLAANSDVKPESKMTTEQSEITKLIEFMMKRDAEAKEQNAELQREAKEREDRHRTEMMNLVATFTTSRTSHASGDGPSTEANTSVGNSSKGKLNIPQIEKLEVDVSLRDFLGWIRQWSNLSTVNRLDSCSRMEQVSLLFLSLSPAMARTVETVLVVEEDSELGVDEILENIQQHLRSKRSIAIDRNEFFNCNQREHESFDDYYTRLMNIAESAQFCEHCFEDSQVSKIIQGTKDHEARKKTPADKTSSNVDNYYGDVP